MRTRFKQSRNNWKINQLYSFKNILMQRKKTHAIGSSKELQSELSNLNINRAAQLSRSLVSTAVSHIGQ